jgi:hypothetical protein
VFRKSTDQPEPRDSLGSKAGIVPLDLLKSALKMVQRAVSERAVSYPVFALTNGNVRSNIPALWRPLVTLARP